MYTGGIGLKLLIWWNPGKSTTCTSSIPRPEDFPKALYTFDIGQNDLAFGFQNSPEEQVRASIPDILDQFSKAVQVSNVPNYLLYLMQNRYSSIVF